MGLSDIMVGRRIALMAGVVLAGLFMQSTQQATSAEPKVEAARDMIEKMGHEFLEVLGPDGMGDEHQLDKLVGLLQEAINLDTTGRLILAKNWRTASDEQREAYLDLFKPYALDTLASKIRTSTAETSLEQFEIVRGEPIGKDDVMISTDLFWPGYPPYRLDWLLRSRDDGHLQAIDVLVEGVSMVVTQRAEFSSVIERQGFDGLLAQMRDQVKRQL